MTTLHIDIDALWPIVRQIWDAQYGDVPTGRFVPAGHSLTLVANPNATEFEQWFHRDWIVTVDGRALPMDDEGRVLIPMIDAMGRQASVQIAVLRLWTLWQETAAKVAAP